MGVRRRTTKTSKKEMNLAVREARAVQPCLAKSQAQRTRRASRIRPRPASTPSIASSRSPAAMSDITGGRSNTKRRYVRVHVYGCTHVRVLDVIMMIMYIIDDDDNGA